MIRNAFDQLVAWLRRNVAYASTHPKAAAILAGLIIALIIISPIPPVP